MRGLFVTPRRGEVPLRGVVAAALDAAGLGADARWEAHARIDGRTGTVVVPVGPDPHDGALLKASDRPWARRELRHQVRVLAALHADERLGEWRELLPRVLAAGDTDGVRWVLETRLPGRDGRRLVPDAVRRAPFVAAALAAVGELHRRTGATVPVGDRELDRWVLRPTLRVGAALRDRERRGLDDLGLALAAMLHGRHVRTGWTHGDYHPGNVLATADGTTTGIVDWCAADPHGMTALDGAGLRLAVEMAVHRRDLGAVVARRLRAGEEATLLLLAWLRHAAQYVATEPSGPAHPVWVHRNVRPVLRAWAAVAGGDVRRCG